MLRTARARFGTTKPSEASEAAGAVSTHGWLLLAIGIGTTLAPLNSTMIAVALPQIQQEFDVSVAQTSWLITIYLVAMAVGQPIGGRLGDLFGRRTVYLAGLVWFGIASAACAFAPNLGLLIFFRTQQALAGALTFPNGAAIVRETIPAEKRGSAFGIIGMSTASAAAIGPPLGGVLVHNFGWQAIFWANVPIIAIALALNYRLLARPGTTMQKRPPFDKTGTALFAISLSALIMIPAMLRSDRAALAAGAGALALLVGLAFVIWELRSGFPVVDVRLFARPEFAASCASIALANFAMYTTLLALPLYMDRVRGDNEQVVGLTLMAMSALAAIWGPIGGRISDSRSRWLPAVFGAAAFFVGMCVLTGAVNSDQLWLIAIALGVVGLGLGIEGAPVQTAAVEAVPMAKTGSAAGIFSTSRYIGSVVGTTILAIMFANNPGPGDSGTFVALFAGLSVAAFAGILVNSRVAPRKPQVRVLE
jgi:EmrB/QacA subfamily drug resistance transporter